MRYSSTSSIKSVASKVLCTDALSEKAAEIRSAEGEDKAPDEEAKADADECLQALERIYRLVTPLLRTLSQGNVTVLLYLDTHRHDTSAVRIAEEVGLTRPRITQIIDELESMGLAKRVKDPRDARKIRVTITRKGKKMVAATRSDFLAVVEDFQCVLGEEDARELTRLLKKSCALFQELDTGAMRS